MLRFTIDGAPVSGNHARKTMARMKWSPKHGRMMPVATTYRTKEGREYRERVAAISFAAALRAGWKPVEWASVDIDYYNIRMDRENVEKETNDGLADSRVIFAVGGDYRIIDGRTRHLWDNGPQRIDITIAEVARADYDTRTKPRRPKPAGP